MTQARIYTILVIVTTSNMKLLHLFGFSIGLLFFNYSVFAQSYILQFDDHEKAAGFFNDHKNEFIDVELLGRTTHIYSVYPKAGSNIRSIQQNRNILHWSPNVSVEAREVPNDPQYGIQWPLPLIAADKAWNEVTQGLSYDQREIVIAVLDNSFQIDHPDLINNIWTNEGEIPNDMVDNDGNGYVDDYYGLHVDENNDNHPLGDHGTKVLGIIGAEGNNDFGISGVNWKVKLMIISGANNSSDIIEGYNYVLDQRKLYNETNGEKGAYVVATNLSAGISNQFGTAFPAWCGMYDAMGEQGILSVTATDNANYNVDTEGDMPTTCESEYLLTVTSTDKFDNKSVLSAFGSTHVDMGAPGAETFSTNSNSDFEEFTGTSAAAPHVAGAIGLLYATNCPQLIFNSLDFPPSAALAIKQSILASAHKLPTLEGKTVSGGRLHIFNAMSELAKVCSTGSTSEREELSIFDLGPNPTDEEVSFKFNYKNFDIHELSIYNTIGQLVYSSSLQPSLFEAPSVTINVSSFTQGMYLLTMTDGVDRTSVKFFKR